MAGWSFLAWISSWLPEQINLIVKNKLYRHELDELDKLEEEIAQEIEKNNTA